jgi:peptidoglycan/LPS O-acetylase OafA/YrhL
MPGSRKEKRIAFLDYLRIFAFMSVLVGHTLYGPLAAFADNPDLHATPRLLARLSLPLFYEGGAGVVVFFLVSGYIITYVIQSERPAVFAVKRFFRIYPLYIFAVLAENLAMATSGQGTPLPVLLQQLSLLGDFFNTPFSLGGVEWTLRIEILFYVLIGLFSCFTRLIPSFSNRRYWLPFTLLVVALGALPPFTSGVIGWGAWPATGNVTLYFPFLLVGSSIYLYERNDLSMPMLLALGCYVYAQFYWLTPKYQPDWMHDHHALIALSIFVAAWLARDHIRAPRLVLFISSLTYSVYLFHHWLCYIVWKALLQLGLSSPLSALFSFLILIGVCIVAMRLVEKPGISIGRRVLRMLPAKH